ncbi:MAG TPA: cytochrome c [Flavobacteriales bacterium]|nr:cytochrome c [Flavobacteriales bacterium]HIN39596.1 cytochrome c [Flavobacteriales bacterium]
MTDNKDRSGKHIAKLIAVIGVQTLIIIGLVGYCIYLKYWTPVEDDYIDTDPGYLIDDIVVVPESLDSSQEKGSHIFKENCATCHTMTDGKLVASGLEGVVNRVPSNKWLVDFITNSDSVYKSGDEYALQLADGDSIYPPMPSYKLSDAEMENLILYMKSF